MFKFIRDMRIRTKLFGMFFISLAGVIVLFVFGFNTLNFVKVNGPIYKNIKAGKDIIADVLPPPKYIIESYLICNRVFFEEYPEDISAIKESLRRFQRLKEEYLERQEVWLKELTPGQLKTELVELSHQPAEKFYRIADEEFIPLILAGQVEQAEKILNEKLGPLYEEHRRHIDEVVRLASAANEQYEEYSRRVVYNRIELMIMLEILLIGIDSILITRFVRLTTLPLTKLVETAKKISGGDLSESGIILDTNDETGVLARAVEEMRGALKATLSGLKDEIARRQKVEDELRDIRDNLEIKVQERTAEVEEINESLLVEVDERRKAQARLDIQYSVARILAEAVSFPEASLKVLQLVCETAKWDFGEIWLADKEADLLRCSATWYKPVDGFSRFDAATRQYTFTAGSGLPGRVWFNKQALWISDINVDTDFTRLKEAVEAGLQTAFAFPIQIGDDVLGVLDFFSRQSRKSDEEMLEMFSAVGSQVGQFIERNQAQDGLKRLNVELEARVSERTAQIQATNKDLSEANAMSTALLDTIPFYMDIVDEEGNVLMVSPKFEAAIGKGWEGRKCWELYKDDKAQCPHCPLRKEPCCNLTETVETAGVLGGKIFSISHSSLVYKGRKAILEIFQDITEEKLSEWQLRKAHEELKSTQSQLVQSAKMASVGQLAGGVAHEINNPLTGVLNNVQLIKMELANKKEFNINDFKGILDIIEESALRCSKITRSLLDFSHAAKETMHPVSLNEAVEKVVTLIGHEMKLQNIAIEKRLACDIPLVSGNFQLLQQVIFDIITNAKWAIHKKSSSGEISIKTWDGREPGKDRVFISISDTGIGIPRENIGHIFEPFFTTKPVGEGTGLGLAIVYNIIKEHKGEITVDSQTGEGTTFTISLPRAKEEI